MRKLSLSSGNWKTIVLVTLLVILGAAVVITAWRIREITRDRAIRELQTRYSRPVDLESLSFSLLGSIRISGRKLVIHDRQPNAPAFISIQSFSARIPYWGLFEEPLRLEAVELKGLRINVPTADQGNQPGHPTPKSPPPPPFIIENMAADGAVLSILPKRPGGEPLVFDIKRLQLQSVGIHRPMKFQTVLINAKPPGLINSQGQFGPWQQDEPGYTPVSGSYTFSGADLGVFDGLSGKLSSKGGYNGILQRIVVDGETDTPDFALDVSRNPVRLTTQFRAIVDGTDGDTLLEPIKAQFLRTSLIARGGVVGTPGRKGKSIRLDVNVTQSNVEDLLTLAMKTDKPPLVGGMVFSTDFDLPSGPEPVIRRLNLDGRFGISSARFTDLEVQRKVNELSQRASVDKDENSNDEKVVSNLSGRFKLNNSNATFSQLSFRVPGASVTLDGSFGLLNEKVDFQGKLKMDAKLSQTTTGVKSVFLKVVDPFFRKNGKTVLPIKINGTLDQPQFGLDF